jgi:hypothetical protein
LPNAVFAACGSSYTIGYQIAPENCSMCACTCPNSANVDRSLGRASFWLSSRTPSYSTHSDESPIGPSVGEVSAWIITFRPPSSSSTSLVFVSMKLVKPSSRSWSSSSLVGYSGSSTVAFLETKRLRCSASKWSRCRWETYR